MKLKVLACNLQGWKFAPLTQESLKHFLCPQMANTVKIMFPFLDSQYKEVNFYFKAGILPCTCGLLTGSDITSDSAI